MEKYIRLVHALTKAGHSADEIVEMLRAKDAEGSWFLTRELTADELAWLTSLRTEEEIRAGVEEIRTTTGPDLGEAIRILEAGGEIPQRQPCHNSSGTLQQRQSRAG
jgi:hypothetical protein